MLTSLLISTAFTKFVIVIHLIIAVLLITLVLLQDAKGGGVFGMGSTGANQVFSASGAANFLVKSTRGLAISFAVTCLLLTYSISHRKGSGSVVDDYVAPAAAESAVPAGSGTTAAPAGGGTTDAPAAAPVEKAADPKSQVPAQAPAEQKK